MDRKWKNKDVTWDEFINLVNQTIRTTETVDEYRKMNRAKQDATKDVDGFVGGALKQGKRRNGHVLSRSLLTLDRDYAVPAMWHQIVILYYFKSFVYSVYKYNTAKTMLQLIILLKRDD